MRQVLEVEEKEWKEEEREERGENRKAPRLLSSDVWSDAVRGYSRIMKPFWKEWK